MSDLDLAALKSLCGEAEVSLENARRMLDETGACADDLEAEALRPLWAVIEARIRARQSLDAVSLRETLRNEPEATRLAAIAVVVEAQLGFTHQRLTLLRESGIRRRVLASLRDAAAALKSGKPLAEVESMLRAAPALLANASQRVRNAAGDSLAMLDHLEASWLGKGEPRLVTGLGDVDETLGGLINNLTVIGARTGVGKSALVAGLVRNWVSRGVKVGVLAYEDDARDMEARIVACQAGVSVKHARGDLFPNEYQRKQITDALEWWHTKEHLLEVDDARPSGSPSDVVASMRTMVARGCRAVLLDNMTCVRLDGADDRRHDLVLEAALADIRGLAQELHVPAIVVGHLKRGQTDADESRRPPKLSDFSNASAWENYARVALGMWRDGDGVALRVLKQTNGARDVDFSLDFREEAAVVVGSRLRVSKPEEPREQPVYSRKRGYRGEAES